ncbi:2-amino-4-hydroxy-6-hydroxymethyldihydropteridine diphosphokinase [Nesterenkonia marinintestina]|uniref:2-amino-4-hydroxy-6- hydroxymethyldihydropteridine diphosphokinase n=1 Tax=Nesterenkonia marinintestina TaxID=2979865 RepID=UPI0021BF6966|nr:2-amino-4-hydroxy-6-hydroxymethyldihydropteridine diphosphokinase [Nesterenkonia sp. GX14115]
MDQGRADDARGSDRIRLTGLTAFGRHGVFEHERRDGQTFRADVELAVDLRTAGVSDDLTDTVSYAVIADLVETAITGEPYDLIEALAERIAVDVLRADRRIRAASVTVHKPRAPLTQRFDDVAVTVVRDRDDLQESTAVRAVLALGSNLGDSEDTLRGAVAALAAADGVRLLGTSPLAVTAPVGGPAGQPDFLNQVVEVETTLSPDALLDLGHEVESAHRRRRDVRWGPRTLDVDIITYGAERIDTDRLQVPHPRAAERAFVLAPWSWMDPEAMLDGRPVRELAEQAPDADGVRRVDRDHAEGDGGRPG